MSDHNQAYWTRMDKKLTLTIETDILTLERQINIFLKGLTEQHQSEYSRPPKSH